MSIKFPEKHNQREVEEEFRKKWQEDKIYQWQNDLSKDQTFVIDTPPPTVSGLLHMGHVFSYTQADFVARFWRMQGKDVFYPMGFDDNGLPTERLVEKQIGKKAAIFEAENGKGSFVNKCKEVVDLAEKDFEQLFNQIALSVDWKQKYQTISLESQRLSQASFLDLFNKGLVEKRFKPVLFDISDRTALAKADIIEKEIDGAMHFLDFTVENSGENLQIMTTRPELLAACIAVMINPDDTKFHKFFIGDAKAGNEGKTGSYCISPLFKVRIPIIADKMVQTQKGTGAVMCCTFGDETDLFWWEKYKLTTKEILRADGKIRIISSSSEEEYKKTYMSSICGMVLREDPFSADISFELRTEDFACHEDQKCFFKNYYKIQGKSLKEARQFVIESLALSPNKITPIKHFVKCAERSGAPIEIISTPQWFIKILPFKEQLKAKARECSWYPEFMRVRIEQWIDGLSWDWCISRQRFFGVKFPAWTLQSLDLNPLTTRQVIAEISQLPVDPQIDLPKGFRPDTEDKPDFRIVVDENDQRWHLTAESDVMDTWATSSITPQLSSHGISDDICFDEARHSKLFPADLRPQAHEIIRSWAFYTITKCYLHSLKIAKTDNGKVIKNFDGSLKLVENEKIEKTTPWKNLMISGWCLAADKTKMSKSKGNVITPTSLIEEKGCDVVRYWASSSNLGSDIAYSEETFKIGQKLVTKLFNSAKFASMQFEKIADLSNEELKKLVIETSDRWILARLEMVIAEYEKQFKIFEYAKAREILEEFFWKDYCDNYLEICKVRSYGLEAEKYQKFELTNKQKQIILNQQLSAVAALKLSLNVILKLFAPFTPFVCEKLYSTVFNDEYQKFKSIHTRGNYAKLNGFKSEDIIFLGNSILEALFEVRKFKSEQSLSMKSEIELVEINREKLFGSKLSILTESQTLNSSLDNIIDLNFILSKQEHNYNNIDYYNLLSFLHDLINVGNIKNIRFGNQNSQLISIFNNS